MSTLSSPATIATRPIDLVADRLEERDLIVSRQGDKITAHCPAHDDRQPSLSVSVGHDDRVLIFCHAGCEVIDVLDALRLEFRNLFADNGKPWTNAAMRRTGAHLERDGRVRLGNVRYLPNANGETKTLAVHGSHRDLWPDPAEVMGETLFLVEGEPDAMTGASLGLPTVARPGAGKWEASWAVRLAKGRRRVVVIPDCDERGRDAARGAAKVIAAHCPDVRLLDLDPQLDDGHDLSAWAADAADDSERAQAAALIVKAAERARRVEPPEARRAVDVKPVGQVEVIRRALLEEAEDPRQTTGPAREELPGAGGLLHRGVATALFGERGCGKTSVAIACAIGAAAAGEKVLYLDRENGGKLIRERMDSALEALGQEWPEGVFARCYPPIDPDWKPEDFGRAVAGLGFTAVIFDSLREYLNALSLRENQTDDISILIAQLVTPLVRRDVAVVLLDNVGHEHTDRPKGSGTKLDAIPQGLQVSTGDEFSPVLIGRIDITCKRSRYGDIGREWSMQLGGDVFELPQANGEAPDIQMALQRAGQREQWRLVVVAVLEEKQPLGRDLLIQATRKRGGQGKDATLRRWLTELAADPRSGIDKGHDGYRLSPGPANRAHPGPTPREGPGPGGPTPPARGWPAAHPGPGAGDRLSETCTCQRPLCSPQANGPSLCLQCRKPMRAVEDGS